MSSGLTVRDALDRGRRTLEACCGPEAGREALFLLAGILDQTPGQTAADPDRSLSGRQVSDYESRLGRRARGEPLQYVEGRAAFRRLHLRVNPSVLIPRPETEQLVERVLEWARGRQRLRALDLGTGSGAIAISLALEGPFERVIGVDISPDALNVARDNSAEAAVEGILDFRLGSLFGALRPGERFHVVVANPPYIASGEAATLPAEVRDWEPPIALYAGPTGLEVIRQIVEGAPDHLESGGLLALEIAPAVAEATLQNLRAAGPYHEPRLLTDLAGLQRIVLAERR